jgi:PAS domain S-box-containing protein
MEKSFSPISESIVQSAGAIILALDLAANITTFNDFAEMVTGYSRAEVLGKNYLRVFVPEDEQDMVKRCLQEAAQQNGARQGSESSIRCKNGIYRNISWNYSRLRGAQGELLSLILIGIDSTDRRQAEDTLQWYARRLKVLNEIDHAIIPTQPPENVVHVALESIRQLIPYQKANVALLDEENHAFTLIHANRDGQQLPARSAECFVITDPALQMTITQMKRLLVADTYKSNSGSPLLRALAADGMRSHLSEPICAGGKLVGLLNLSAANAQFFNHDFLVAAAEVASELGVALQNVRLFEQVKAANTQLQTVSRRLVEIRESERRSLARELHDEVGQLLTGLKFSLESVRRVLPEGETEALEDAQAITDQLVTKVREMSLNLRPSMLDDMGLFTTLTWHFERYSSTTGIKVRFSNENLKNRRFSSEIETAVFRIVQEALTNVARYAGVREVTVGVVVDDGNIIISVEDRGVGFDEKSTLAAGKTMGLTGMRERCILLGGSFWLQTAPGKGTRVYAQLPI